MFCAFVGLNNKIQELLFK